MDKSRLGPIDLRAGDTLHTTPPARRAPDRQPNEPEAPTKINDLAIRRVDLHAQRLLPATSTSIGPLRPAGRRRRGSHDRMDHEKHWLTIDG
jgi:hypothetical protein